MELSSEDLLRLNVLLANKPLAIRINESSLVLQALLGEGEATINLSATGRPEKYLQSVRSFLSERALGSPRGYPLYLQRWSRQGQMRQESLEQLLLLGDPTAVYAVICAQGLTDEIARRAWWAVEEAENARCMLEAEAVVKGGTGAVLARYLVDYLPFETETETMIKSVRLALQPGLLEREVVIGLWKKAARKAPYLVGFIAALPDDLPEPGCTRRDCDLLTERLRPLAESGNPYAELISLLVSAKGQLFLQTCRKILEKPSAQEVVSGTFDVLRERLGSLRPEGDPDLTMEQLREEARQCVSGDERARACIEMVPELAAECEALSILSGLGYGVIRPTLKGSTVMGSLMRKKLKPVLEPIMAQLECLLGMNRA